MPTDTAVEGSLFRPSFDLSPYTFAGDHLREIAFPLGGIGTGCVSLDGRGNFQDWEIFNRPNKGSFLMNTFPMLSVRSEGEAPTLLAVQGPKVRHWIGELKPWRYGHGDMWEQMDGLPCFDSVEFCGTFPFARVRFKKPSLPIEVELCAFNPFIPLDIESSSYPGACLVYRLKNTGDKPVEATLAWSMMNPVGFGDKVPQGEKDGAKGEVFQGENCRGIRFTNTRIPEDSLHHGTAAISTNWPDTTILPMWDKREWFDTVQALWNEFINTGRLENGPLGKEGERSAGSLGAVVKLAPGEEVEIPFFISWVFPVTSKYWDGVTPKSPHVWKPYYATQYATAWDAADGFFGRFDELSLRTRAFEEALFTSTLPSEVIQSVSATASILHSPTVLRLEDGTFWAWEGCSPEGGCCEGTCSHVWNYALAHAYLFPEMQKSMRRAEYANNFNCGPRGKEGALIFRTQIPLGKEANLWHAASDGQLGGIVQLYRDWKLLGDDKYLREMWPFAKRALEFSWAQWDKDRDGLAESDMHNTYDINFVAPNPLTQFFYLAALRAGEEMCRHLGDTATADGYRALYESGREKTEERLWNGEYFFEEGSYVAESSPKYQHGAGCLSDQVFGQLAASVAGLGHLVDKELIQSALRAIFEHNFKSPLSDHANLQRVYAVQDETGLILCSWPRGERPYYPFVYSDEVWTGIEYQFATHLALEGMSDECLAIVRGIRARYDGRRRNPWNEFECGSHYARALASYGLLLSFSGFRYDAVAKTATLDPLSGGDCSSFFCTPQGWGVARKVGGETRFDLAEGCLFATYAQ